MPSVVGTLPVPVADAATALRQAAGRGFSLDEGHSDHDQLVFTKGATLVSWGSQLAAALEAVGESETRVSVSPHETFTITDWGRGRRARAEAPDRRGRPTRLTLVGSSARFP